MSSANQRTGSPSIICAASHLLHCSHSSYLAIRLHLNTHHFSSLIRTRTSVFYSFTGPVRLSLLVFKVRPRQRRPVFTNLSINSQTKDLIFHPIGTAVHCWKAAISLVIYRFVQYWYSHKLGTKTIRLTIHQLPDLTRQDVSAPVPGVAREVWLSLRAPHCDPENEERGASQSSMAAIWIWLFLMNRRASREPKLCLNGGHNSSG